MVERDLLGPWDGPEERFAPGARGPRDRYLVGMLGPKPALKSARESADRVPDTEPGVSGDGEPDLPEIVTPQNLGRMWASSMGLTFAVAADVDVLHAVVEWGSYDTEQAPAPDGRVRAVWHRVRRCATSGRCASTASPATRSRWSATIAPRRCTSPSRSVPATGSGSSGLALVNAQQEPDSRPDKAWLYQVPDHGHRARRRRRRVRAGRRPRGRRVAARTIRRSCTCGCSTATSSGSPSATTSPSTYASPSPGPGPHAKLETTWLPHHDVPATVAAGSVGAAELSMDELARPTRLRCGAVSRRSPTATRAGSTTGRRRPVAAPAAAPYR